MLWPMVSNSNFAVDNNYKDNYNSNEQVEKISYEFFPWIHPKIY